MKNRKMILQFEHDDDAFKEGGPLAEKKWLVGDIGIYANAGMSHFNIVTQDGTETKICVSVRDPYLVVASASTPYSHPPFEKPFDIHEFEARLQDAKDEVKSMNDYLDGAYDDVLTNVMKKAALDGLKAE